ncbi:MAG: flagellar biosynthesis protein FliQ [Deltaproteobacteria bacterium]|nr:flagellar biosynthesis protein FliQ [Deltaproteobacteria bacterium]
MSSDFFIVMAKQALFLALILTGPPVLAAMVVGLIISILQATTQIQEQTLTFVPKLVAVAAALAVSGPWMLQKLMYLTSSLMEELARHL